MNIWVPKFKILEPKAEIKVSCGFRGRYQLHARRLDGTVRASTPWFSNLILNSGKNHMSSNPTQDKVNWCAIGTGTVAPDVAQTSLESLSATTTTLQVASFPKNTSVLPYTQTWTLTYRFAFGAVVGNMTEVGVGWSSNGTLANLTLFSRELIRDAIGDPTSFTVLADEQLDVVYEVVQFIPDGDVTGTIDITGSGTHDFIARAADIDGSSWLASNTSLYGTGPRISSAATAYSGAIGDIFNNPGGTSSNGGSGTMALSGAYIPDSYYRNVAATWALNNANYGGGIGTTVWNLSGANSVNRHFQFGFTPNILKDATKTLQLVVQVSHAFDGLPPP